jgi:hypothetical protein
MAEPRWPESIDPVVERARFSGRRGEPDWWESAREVIEKGLSPEDLNFLATVGLAELASQSHRANRDESEPCMGHRLMLERDFPDKYAELLRED